MNKTIPSGSPEAERPRAAGACPSLSHAPAPTARDLPSLQAQLAAQAKALCLARAELLSRTEALEIEHRLTEAILQDSEGRYRELVQHANSAILRWRADGTITFVNEYAESFFGYGPGELLGRDVRTLVPESESTGRDLRPLVDDIVARPDRYVNFINENVCRDGRRAWMTWTNRPVMDAEGRVTEVLAVGSDVTARVAAERAVEGAATEWRATFDAISDAVFLLDANGIIRRCNKAFQALVAKPFEEMVGRRCCEVVHGASEPVSDCPFMRAQRSHRREVMPFALNDRWFDVIVDPVLDSAGRTAGAVHILTDVTERRRATRRQALVVDVLSVLNRQNDLIRIIADILHLIKEETDIEAVGVRLKEGDDYPYYVANGFPAGFIQAERFLCARDAQGAALRDECGRPVLECMCGNIIRGRFDPSKPFFTAGGSFWTNGTTELLASTTEEDRQSGTRNRCNAEGYESVALVPLRAGEEVIGLLQLNDHRKGMFTVERIRFFEGLGSSIGVALHRLTMEEALRRGREEMNRAQGVAHTGSWRYDAKRRELTWSDETYRIFGVQPGVPVTHEAFLERVHPDDRARVQERRKAALAGHPYDVEHRIVVDHSVKWVHERAEMEYDGSGAVSGALGIVQDITERKESEEALARSETQYRTLYESSRDALVTAAPPNWHFTSCNQATVRMFGAPDANDFVGHAPWEYSPPAQPDGRPSAEKAKEMIEIAMRQGSHFFEWTHRRRDGTDFPATVLLSRVDIGGSPYFQATIRDITDQKAAETALRENAGQLRRMMDGTVKAMTTAIEARDPYTAGHERRVAQLACEIGLHMGFTKERTEGLRIAGYLHDIGKIAVPAEILSKPGRISDCEMGIIRAHPQFAFDILKDIDFVWPVAQAAFQHHERLDGSGYPKGIRGEEIIIEARILAVADVVEAMSSHRPYRAALGVEKALEEIAKGKEKIYDASVVEACVAIFRDKKFAFQ
jgi:PAS domain S-box-containing protein